MSVQVTCYKIHSETWPRIRIKVEPIQRTNQCISGGRYWGTWWSWIEISTFRWPLSIRVDLHWKLKLTSNNYKLILQHFELLFVSYCRVHALIFKLRWNAGFHLNDFFEDEANKRGSASDSQLKKRKAEVIQSQNMLSSCGFICR